MVTLYNVVSSDGYIARPDGTEDFIPDVLWPHTLEVFSRYDALVMGRKTYEAIQSYDASLLSEFERLPIRKIVVTRNPAFALRPGYELSTDLEAAVSAAPNVLVSSGTEVNRELLERRIPDRVIQQVVPIAIGQGVRPYADFMQGVVQREEGPIGTEYVTYDARSV